LNILISDIRFFFYNIINNNIINTIFLFILRVSFILFFLDNFRLSSIGLIRYIQVFSFISIIFIFFIFVYFYVINAHYLISINHNSDINLNGYVALDKKPDKAIAHGLSTMLSEISLGGIMVGVCRLVTKTLVKSSIPLIQKTNVVIISPVIV
jgi:energy-coupling factor transporter transmembrane protein EcfT